MITASTEEPFRASGTAHPSKNAMSAAPRDELTWQLSYTAPRREGVGHPPDRTTDEDLQQKTDKPREE